MLEESTFFSKTVRLFLHNFIFLRTLFFKLSIASTTKPFTFRISKSNLVFDSL